MEIQKENITLQFNAFFFITLSSLPLFLLFKKETRENLFARIAKILKNWILTASSTLSRGVSGRTCTCYQARRAEADTTRGKNEQREDIPGTPICTSSRARFIFDWFHFTSERRVASRRAACFVYVLGETGSSPRIPMTVLMECANGCFTNQQRSRSRGPARGNYWGSANAAVHNWSRRRAVIFRRARGMCSLQMCGTIAPASVFPPECSGIYIANISANDPSSMWTHWPELIFRMNIFDWPTVLLRH